MSPARSEGRAETIALALVAVGMTAQQVAGKATRDTLFLAHFPVAQWPVMLAWSSIASILLAVASTRWMTRLGPRRMMPAAFAVSAVAQLGIGLVSLGQPRVAGVLLYLLMAALVPVLLSGFWSIFSERFDPRTAKRQIGRLGALSMLGGLAGGVLANAVASRMGVAAMLPFLAGMHGLCAVGLGFLDPKEPGGRPADAMAAEPPVRLMAGFGLLRSRPYLRDLALLVLLATVSAVFLDYVFRTYAAAAFQGDALMRVFSWFHTGVALAAFLVQILVSRISLDRVRLAESVATLPIAVAGGSLGVLLLPGLWTAAIARALEMLLSSSFFRSGYELLYTPVPAREKRATKALVDVGMGRAGDAVGGAIVVAILPFAGQRANVVLLALAIAVAVLAWLVTRRLHRGYMSALETSLIRHASDADRGPALDSSQRIDLATLGIPFDLVPGDVSQTVPLPMLPRTLETPLDPVSALALGRDPARGHGTSRLPSPVPPAHRTAPAGGMNPAVPAVSPVVPAAPRVGGAGADLAALMGRLEALRSGDPERVRAALRADAPLGPELVPHVIALLAEDAVSSDAGRALRRIAPRLVGQLADVLLDPEQPLEVRRRLPRVLSAAPSERSVEALLRGLEDIRFKVRMECGLALVRLHERAPELVLDSDRLLAAVLREVAMEKHVWQGRRDLSRLTEEESPSVDLYVRQRAGSSMQHVFTLLSLAVPEQTLLRIAFNGLHSEDPKQRGTALEYLELVLPPQVREEIWPFLEERGRRRDPTRSRDQIISDLVQSNESMRISIAELRRMEEEKP